MKSLWVSLVSRSTLKRDIGFCASELVYGDNITITRRIFHHRHYAQQLKKHMRELKISLSRGQQRPSRVPSQLTDCTHIFVRRDGIQRPLQSVYAGLYKVLSRSHKVVTMEMFNKADSVSIDGAKPAFTQRQLATTSHPRKLQQLKPLQRNLEKLLDQAEEFSGQTLAYS
ncbi:unnamed protein product [Heterobilharzia americana]|nr:unnamed protein product [Heterobilharzia americana]